MWVCLVFERIPNNRDLDYVGLVTFTSFWQLWAHEVFLAGRGTRRPPPEPTTKEADVRHFWGLSWLAT